MCNDLTCSHVILNDAHAQLSIEDSLRETGVDLILGNDLVRGDEVGAPVLPKVPVPKNDAQVGDEETFLESPRVRCSQ